ncbi:MAG TPA: hypothetical protein VKR58_09440 [Aquella sp.]|nr:hypothetical protein [Aquella sp.]
MQNYSEIEYEFFCNGLEKQYKESKDEGMFEVLKVLELDKTHSDCNLVQAIDYFKEKDGIVEQDAPMDFLTECEKNIVKKDEKFRSELYCMLLSKKFAEAIKNKSIFLQDSFKYSFSSQQREISV